MKSSPESNRLDTEESKARALYLGEIPPEQRRLEELRVRRAAEQKRYRRSAKGRAAIARAKRNYNQARRLQSPFIGVDGEGSESAYLLLRAGNDYLHTGSPLSYRACLRFLADLDPSFTYVAFFFDYDVTMMLRGMPEERLRRLLRPELRRGKTGQQLPIDIDGFQIDYRPGKEFKVRRKGLKWVTINDVGSFFQCSFVKALTAWGIGSEEELAKVKTGKDMRSDFTVMDRQVIEYNALECKLLEQLMTKFGAACRGINYLPRRWQGPGEIAAAMLQFHGIPRRQSLTENVPLDLFEAANKAYYGGRFETTAVGVLKGPLWAYDINSAYPHAIRQLPCLEHGEWTLDHEPTSNLYLAFGSYKPNVSILLGSEPEPYLYGFPNRTDECHIQFPGSGRGWYWSVEIETAIHQRLRPEIVWNYHKRCDCEPFSWVPELYTKRKQWQASSESLAGNMGIALKLALNSLYGKMAQSIGSAPYANPLYASLITAITRSQLYGMVHGLSGCKNGNRCGESVFYLATDGLFSSTSPKSLQEQNPEMQHSYTLGSLLGEWGVESINEDLLLVQPGLYIGAEGSHMKTRGIPKTKVERYAQAFYQAWRTLYGYGFNPGSPCSVVKIPFHQFMGLKQAMAFNSLGRAGQWEDLPRLYGYEWQSKRNPHVTERKDNYFRTLPNAGRAARETLGYSKDIGRWLDNNRPWYEQKVWTEAQPDEATASVDRSEFRIEW